MRICRFDDDRLGLVLDDHTSVADVTPALDALPALRWPLPPGDPLIANLARLTPRIASLAATAPKKRVAEVKLKSPVANPTKIIAAPVNYLRHRDEARADRGINFGAEVKTIEHYGLFLKAATSLVGAGEGVRLPPLDRRIDHEVELAVIIGRSADQVPRERAMEHVAGYAIALDMTVCGPEDRSWRKSFASFAVLGPWLVTADEIADPGQLDLSLSIGGVLRQSANTRDLIFDVPKLIEYASAAYTLHPRDVIMTGTPEGVAPVKPGDIMTCAIERIGTMRVGVSAAAKQGCADHDTNPSPLPSGERAG